MDKTLDAQVAERIMGYIDVRQVDGYRGSDNGSWWGYPPKATEHGMKIPYYTSYAGDDYEVLEHIRGSWQYPQLARFNLALWTIWAERAGDMGLPTMDYATYYEPGDYSKAALAALGQEADAMGKGV